MSSRTIIGLLVGLSTAAAACSSDPASTSRPRVVASGGSSSTSTGGTDSVSTGNTAGTTVIGDQGGTTSAAGGTDSGQAGTFGSVAGTTGTAGTGPMIDPCVPIDSLKALPMAVDGPFIPGGYFFDPALPANVSGIVHAACETRPDATTHYGSCHKWSFTPSMLGVDPTTMMPSTYGGSFWLAGSATNWGTAAGENVAPGAQTVKFRAWGVTGTEVVAFNVGGVVGTTCLDSVNLGPAGMSINLTTTPTDYVISLTGQTYPKGVIGGFSWTAKTASTTVPVSFYVDDIRWTADPT